MVARRFRLDYFIQHGTVAWTSTFLTLIQRSPPAMSLPFEMFSRWPGDLANDHESFSPCTEQGGISMDCFRTFPYRGSRLRLQDGRVNTVFHEPITAKVQASQTNERSP
jgi:hypothetical protein